MSEKTKGDRLKETIRLLKELERVGITATEPGYTEIKEMMTQWVKDGVKNARSIELVKYNRVADVALPSRADKAASINLRVV
jgi:hypothetical protein